MKVQFKALLLLLLVCMPVQGQHLSRPPVNQPRMLQVIGSSTTVVIICWTTIYIFWYYINGQLFLEIYITTTCYVFIIHHTYWRSRCLREASKEINNSIEKKSAGGQLKVKSSWDKSGNMKGLEEEDEKGKVKQLNIEAKIEKTTSKGQQNIESKVKSVFEKSIQKKNVNPPEKKIKAAQAKFRTLREGPNSLIRPPTHLE